MPEGKRFTAGPENKGRPKGSRTKALLALEAMMDGQAETITAKVIEAAKLGDPMAMRLVMERIYPIRRGRPTPFAMPAIDQAAGVDAALGQVIAEVAAGTMTADEAQAVAGLLQAKRQMIETSQLDARLRALEEHRQHDP